jgi:PHP family Zn ribbon phosphoesterase
MRRQQAPARGKKPMLKTFNCDLHIHTCLSPCAHLDMHPQAIIKKALAAGLDLIAICDHNSSENVSYVIEAARGKNISILPGMEITTNEEVHVVALFETLDALASLQENIYLHLPGENDEARFGVQAIVNEKGEVEGMNERLLIGATTIGLNDTIAFIHKLNGLAIAAHIDRESFSVLGQLGFIDPSAGFDALEITAATGFKKARIKYADLSNYSFILSSDSHFLNDIGKASTKIVLEQASVAELKMAFNKQNGRRVLE